MEKPEFISVQPHSETESSFVGHDSQELKLDAARHLIERLEAAGELTDRDKSEAKEMITDLMAQQEEFDHEKIPVPQTLIFAIAELELLLEGGHASVREIYAHKESEPVSSADVLAEAGALELEIIEQQAIGTLWGGREQEMRDKILSVLPKLDVIAETADSDTRDIVRSQKNHLESFLR